MPSLKKEDINIEAKDLERVMTEHLDPKASITPKPRQCDDQKVEQVMPAWIAYVAMGFSTFFVIMIMMGIFS